jgi:hypothetical protein
MRRTSSARDGKLAGGRRPVPASGFNRTGIEITGWETETWGTDSRRVDTGERLAAPDQGARFSPTHPLTAAEQRSCIPSYFGSAPPLGIWGRLSDPKLAGGTPELQRRPTT